MQKQILVGIAQMKISQDQDEILVAPNLGSCVGVAIYETNLHLAGLIHCLLPLSKSDLEKAQNNPCMYVDTGVALLLDQMFAHGADKKNIIIKVAGGGNINDTNNVFEIGKKNYTVLKKLLWKNNLLLKSEHIGDAMSKTISLHVATGKVFVKTNGQVLELK